MAAAIELRGDLSGDELRRLARDSRDAKQVRRLLALAVIAEGGSRTEAARVGFLSTGLAVLVLWNAATLGGAVAGEALGDPRTYGLDAAVGAAFLALLWPRLADRRNQLVALLGAAVALSLVPVTAAGVPVLAAAGVALLTGVLSRRPDPTEYPDHDDLPGGGHR